MPDRPLLPLPPFLVEPILRRALEEDLGRAGDITTMAVVPAEAVAEARLVARRPGCLAGVEIAAAAFRLLDPRCEVELSLADGARLQGGETLATVRGPARAVLGAERTALNLLGRLSGIATATRQLVDLLDGTGAGVACTRKTTPGLRALEKYAVRCGGGSSHRFGLDDAVLIKDNHLALAGSLPEAVVRARAAVGHLVKVEVEVDTLEQLDLALACPVDAILLDNFSLDDLREAVARTAGRVVLEASGGITPESARAIAQTGVDLLSVGWLTHSAGGLDVGLDL